MPEPVIDRERGTLAERVPAEPRADTSCCGKALLAGVLLLLSGAGARGQDLRAKGNLIEYSCDYFGESGMAVRFVEPPEIKLYQDGTIIFRRDGQFYIGEISSEQLELARSKLRHSALLQKSSYLAKLHGDPMLHHGGLCHFLYLEGSAESRLIATSVVPRRGPWRRLVEYLRGLLPVSADPFLPAALVITVADRHPNRSSRQWPLADRFDLAAATAGQSVVTDAEVVRAIFRDLHKSFIQADRGYQIEVVAVPGWFEPGTIEKRLYRLIGQN